MSSVHYLVVALPVVALIATGAFLLAFVPFFMLEWIWNRRHKAMGTRLRLLTEECRKLARQTSSQTNSLPCGSNGDT